MHWTSIYWGKMTKVTKKNYSSEIFSKLYNYVNFL